MNCILPIDLTGNAYSRAPRGHLIVDTALNTLIVDELRLTVDSSTELLQHSDEMYQQFLKGSITPEEIETHFELNNLKAEVEKVKNVMGEVSKTAKLWLGYQSIVSITRKIIRADRLANWRHLPLHYLYMMPVATSTTQNRCICTYRR